MEAVQTTVTFYGALHAMAAEGRKLRGVIVARKGEMIGHQQWADEKFLSDLCDLGNALAARVGGVKSRFGHPSLLNDALGKVVGSFRNYGRDGELVRADWTGDPAAKLSPVFTKDPVPYILALARETPKKAGLSLVFDRDYAGELGFMLAHGGRPDQSDDVNSTLDGFKSPDPDNVNNCLHIRIAALHATDFVDEAATGEGIFQVGPLRSAGSAAGGVRARPGLVEEMAEHYAAATRAEQAAATARQAFMQAIERRRAADPSMSYSDAVRLTIAAHPELARPVGY